MKKWICWLLCLLLCMAAAAAPAEVPTEKEVIRITDAEELLKMAEAPEASYILENDIDMTGVEWKPVHFYGTLDGNGHAICNLRVTTLADETMMTVDGNNKRYDTLLMGFFSIAENAVIRNLTLKDATVRCESDDHTFIALLAAGSVHSTFENVNVTGSAGLWCAGRMAGVGGIVGFGTGDIIDSEADVTLVYVDTNTKIRSEEFMGAAVADGFMNCYNNHVRIDGYASIFGYSHCGGLIGMHRQWEKMTKENKISYINNNTAEGRITFFERLRGDRRAYCAGIVGERLNKYTHLEGNDDSGFERKEVRKYDEPLLPEGWEPSAAE